MATESSVLLDTCGRKLLSALQGNARLSFAELGRQVGLSPSATAERLRRLEEAGVIRGYRADLDPEAIGYPILAFIRMTCDGGKYGPFLKIVRQLDEVQECHHLTGGDAFVLKVALRSIQNLEALVEKLLAYGVPTTSLVLSSPVVQRPFELQKIDSDGGGADWRRRRL